MTQPPYSPPPPNVSEPHYGYGLPPLQQPPTPDGSPDRKPFLRRAWVRATGAGVIGLALVGLGVVIGQSTGGEASADDRNSSTVAEAAANETPRLEGAYESCWKSGIGETVQLGDGGTSIIIDTGSKYGSMDSVACVLSEIETPESVVAQVDSTTALMGVQQTEHDGFDYTWSYHPDNGLNMVITDTEASN